MMNSSVTKSFGSEYESSEESGWTQYLEDFSYNDQKENLSFCSSLVSDAAWNGFEGYGINQIKKLNFKNPTKRSNYMKYSCGDDLEDTASSPVNSPKVSTLNQMEVKYGRINHQLAFGDFLQGKQAKGSNDFSSEFRRDEEIGENIISERRKVNEFIDPKKKGLCLVPVSALMNYIG